MSRIFSLDTKDVALVCLCYVENATSAQIRYAVRRLRRKVPDAFILVTMVGQASNIDDEEVLQYSPNIDFVKQSLSDTVDRIFAIATSASQTQDPNVEQSELIAAQ
jgi:tRNA A37 methylthiotransferase MiaB